MFTWVPMPQSADTSAHRAAPVGEEGGDSSETLSKSVFIAFAWSSRTLFWTAIPKSICTCAALETFMASSVSYRIEGTAEL